MVIARHPDARQCDVAQRLDITERTASKILAHLCDSGYVTKHRQLGDAVDARRNRYDIIDNVTLHDPFVRHRTVGEFVAFIDDIVTTRPSRCQPLPPSGFILDPDQFPPDPDRFSRDLGL